VLREAGETPTRDLWLLQQEGEAWEWVQPEARLGASHAIASHRIAHIA
jgi:hypothetical protein